MHKLYEEAKKDEKGELLEQEEEENTGNLGRSQRSRIPSQIAAIWWERTTSSGKAHSPGDKSGKGGGGFKACTPGVSRENRTFRPNR